MTSADWSEAERLWRSGAAMDEKLAMVERALAALGGGKREDAGHDGPASNMRQGRKG